MKVLGKKNEVAVKRQSPRFHISTFFDNVDKVIRSSD